MGPLEVGVYWVVALKEIRAPFLTRVMALVQLAELSSTYSVCGVFVCGHINRPSLIPYWFIVLQEGEDQAQSWVL